VDIKRSQRDWSEVGGEEREVRQERRLDEQDK
jgi:hypothetical protein